jgi:O-antigen/teichoic acid export membrane protein
VKLLSHAEVVEKWTTMEMPKANGTKQLGNLQVPSRLEQKQREKVELKSLAPSWKPETFGYDIDADPEIEKYATIQMQVLKGIAKRQDQPGSSMQSEITGAAGNAAILGFGSIIGYILKYGNNLLIQHILGAGAYGLFTLSVSVVTLIASLFNLGMDDTMVRYVALYRGRKQVTSLRGLAIFCSTMAASTGIIGALLVVYFAPTLADSMHKPKLVPILQIMASMIPLLSMQVVWGAGLQGFKEFKSRILVQRFIVPLIVFLLMAIALFFFNDITGVAMITVIGTSLSTVTNLYFLLPAFARTVEPGPGVYEFREWFSFALPNFLTTIVNVVLDSVDTLLLGFFAVPLVAIGQYAAAIKISGFILMPLNSFNVMFTPTIAELYGRGEMQKLETMFKVVTKWSITFCLPIFGVATLFSVPLLGLSGNSFVGAWPLLIALAMGSLLSAAAGPVGYMLLMTGYQKFSFLNSLTVVILNAVLGVILTPHLGAMGVAISTGLSIGIVNLIRLIEVRLFLKMHPYSLETIKPVVAGVISALITGNFLYLLSFTNVSFQLFRLHLSIEFILIPVFLGSYIVLLALFKLSPEDKIVVDKLQKKLRRGKKKNSPSV